jgi:putative oxidoreductase
MATFKKSQSSFLVRSCNATIQSLDLFLTPVLLLGIRVWIAQVFWNSGLSKIQSWSTTIMLFENEYKVPLLSPEVAAYLTATFEITCPPLLVLGLGARLATLPLLVITAVIQFTYLNSPEHVYWAFLLGIILCYGPGQISIDALLKRRFFQSYKPY